MTPADIARMTSPSVPFEKSKRSWMNGMWATHEPTAAPLMKNTAAVAGRKEKRRVRMPRRY
jgi:hypothetical protein